MKKIHKILTVPVFITSSLLLLVCLGLCGYVAVKRYHYVNPIEKISEFVFDGGKIEQLKSNKCEIFLIRLRDKDDTTQNIMHFACDK